MCAVGATPTVPCLARCMSSPMQRVPKRNALATASLNRVRPPLRPCACSCAATRCDPGSAHSPRGCEWTRTCPRRSPEPASPVREPCELPCDLGAAKSPCRNETRHSQPYLVAEVRAREEEGHVRGRPLEEQGVDGVQHSACHGCEGQQPPAECFEGDWDKVAAAGWAHATCDMRASHM